MSMLLISVQVKKLLWKGLKSTFQRYKISQSFYLYISYNCISVDILKDLYTGIMWTTTYNCDHKYFHAEGYFFTYIITVQKVFYLSV